MRRANSEDCFQTSKWVLTVTVKVKVPACDGVPESCPALDMVVPGGKAPAVTEKVVGGRAPSTERETAPYASPKGASGSDAVVMVRFSISSSDPMLNAARVWLPSCRTAKEKAKEYHAQQSESKVLHISRRTHTASMRQRLRTPVELKPTVAFSAACNCCGASTATARARFAKSSSGE